MDTTGPRYLRGFDDLRHEHGPRELDVHGALPAGLRGTLYSNGPVRSSLLGERYPHWFDGDGGVVAVRFRDGRAYGAVRTVESRALVEERASGRMLFAGYRRRFHPRLFFRGVFDRTKNSANTSVLAHAGRLYALWEGGRPTEIDPESLATIGESDFGGVVATYSAHPKVSRGEVLNFGLRLGYPVRLEVYRTDRAGRTTVVASVKLEHPTMIHDFAVTERHFVFFVAPIRLRLLPALFGLGSYEENLRYDPRDGTEVIVIPRDGGEVVRFRTDAFFQFHFARAFERRDDIVVDFVRHPDFGVSEWLRQVYVGAPLREAFAVPTRATITPKSERIELECLWDHPAEFPVWDGAAHIYLCAHRDHDQVRVSLMDRLARLDVESGDHTLVDLGPERYPGEPLVVGTHLLSVVYDALEHRSFVAVLDASSMELVAECWFDQHIPPRFHSTYVDSVAAMVYRLAR